MKKKESNKQTETKFITKETRGNKIDINEYVRKLIIKKINEKN